MALLIVGALSGSGTVFTERSDIHASGDFDNAEAFVPGEIAAAQVDASESERYYAFELTDSSFVSVTMTSDTSGLILDLLSGEGERLEHSTITPFGRSLTVSYDLMAGDYLLRVSTSDGAPHTYTITGEITPIAETFPESYPGENETLETASPIILGETVSGQIAQFNPVRQVYDQDAYRFTLEDHTNLILTFTGELSVADIQIVDANQTVYFDRMAYATGLDGEGTSWKISLNAGEYFLRVRSTGYESSGTYSFVLDEQDL